MKNISIIIPTYNFVEIAGEVINAVIGQTYPASEIIIIDSSENNEIASFVEKLESKIPIIYKKYKRLFPGEARNKGVELSKHEFIGFIDSKTVPKKIWLEENIKYLETNHTRVVFGNTQYHAKTDFQMCVKACTYGNYPIETTPGTLISREDFENIGSFQEKIRTGDDLAWRLKVKSTNLKWATPKVVTLLYSQLENNLLSTIKRFFTYQISASSLEIQNTPRNIFLAIMMILTSIIILQWNAIIGWEDNFLYIPNITKIYTLLVLAISLGIFLIDKNFIKDTLGSFFAISYKLLIIITFLVVAFYWNGRIANWAENSILYIPHITKIYLISIFGVSFFYRGLYFPLSHGILIKDLLPFWWLKVGMIGVILDIAKAPGYILGALMKLKNSGK